MDKLTLEGIAATRDEISSIENDGGDDFLLIGPKISNSSLDFDLYAARISWDGDVLHSWFDIDAEFDERLKLEYEIHEVESEAELQSVIDGLMDSSRKIEALLSQN